MSYEQDIATKVRAPIAEVEALDTRTLTGAVTLTRLDGKYHVFDPGGAHRDVTIYAGGPEDVGRSEYFYNAADAAENLVIKDSAAATLITLGQSQWAQIICNEARAHVVIGRGASAVASSTDTITETTPAAGVTIDGLRIKDATINPAAGGTAFIDLSNVATGEGDIILADNLAVALEVREAANSYIKIVTTNSSEAVNFGKPITMTSGMASILDLSAASTGNADVVLADNLADAFTIRQSTNPYLTVVTTNDAERVTLGKVMAYAAPVVVDMADAAGALVYGTGGAGEFKVTSNIIQVDPNSGQASEILTLPPVATSVGVMLVIINTGGEGIVVKDVATATIITLDTAQNGLVVCDGTTWAGFMGAIT